MYKKLSFLLIAIILGTFGTYSALARINNPTNVGTVPAVGNQDMGGFNITNGGTITGTTISATSTTATSTFAGTTRIGTDTTNQNLLGLVAPSGKDYSASVSTGGVLNLTTTNSTGAGLIIYNNQGATASGRLMALTADNPAFDQQVFYADQDGTSGAGVFNCDLTTGNALECVTISSLKQDKTAVGITGQETALGTLKVTHDYPGVSDANAAALSLRANGVGTAAQGIFFDAENSTTGKILNLRNNGVELFTLTSVGNVGIGTSSPAFLLDLYSTGTTTQRIDSNSVTKGACIALKDTDGVGYTYVYGNNGALTASTVACN